ncbi:MAG: OmpH family outer membrane protein [Flavobacteriales bacterium]|jgi:hypothetical protein
MRLRLWVIWSVLLLPSAMTYAQGGCGFFDKAQCISALPEHAIEQSKLKVRATQLDDTLKLLGHQYQRTVMSDTPHGRILHPTDIARLTEEIRSLEKFIEEYQQLAQRELAAMEEASLAMLNGILLVHLKAYCEANGLSVMVERDALIYGPQCVDHTPGLLEFLKRP